MKVGIMQPYFLPYIGYWQLIGAVDRYVIYDDVNYINRGWISRNNILLNNRPFLFTLTLVKRSQNKLINEIAVGADQEKLIKTFEKAYRKAPCFDKTFELVKQILEYGDKNLARFIGNSIMLITDYLGLSIDVIYSSALKKDPQLKGQFKILGICDILGATGYVNPIGGVELYSKKLFDERGVGLQFVKTKPIEYRQFGGTFVPNLSILDVMMFNPVEKIREMLDNFELLS